MLENINVTCVPRIVPAVAILACSGMFVTSQTLGLEDADLAESNVYMLSLWVNETCVSPNRRMMLLSLTTSDTYNQIDENASGIK